MSETTRNGRGRHCPVCGRGTLRTRLISEVFEYGDDGEAVLVRTQDVPVEDCDVCGESFSGPKAARIRHLAIGQAVGLLPPQDIRALRERSGQSPDQFAKLIGVATDRLSQWESGRSWQDRTADRLMRLLALRPENAEHLNKLAKTPASDPNGEKPETQARVPRKHGSSKSAEQTARSGEGRFASPPRPIRPINELDYS